VLTNCLQLETVCISYAYGTIWPISVESAVKVIEFKNAMILKTGLGVCQGHWKCHHSIEHIRLPIDVL